MLIFFFFEIFKHFEDFFSFFEFFFVFIRHSFVNKWGVFWKRRSDVEVKKVFSNSYSEWHVLVTMKGVKDDLI